jgi:hypothetical protein
VTTVRRLKAGEGTLMRELRLALLRDSPNSFGRTLADALALPETYWIDMERSVTDPGRHVMLVAEDGSGVGLALESGVIEWARRGGFDTLASNTALSILEMRLGFGDAAR